MNFKVDINVCRVCMKSENGTSLLKDAGLLEKFVYTTKLKVKAEDCLPAILCEKCITRLKLAYEFCRTATIADKHLRQFISKISNDFEEVTKTLPTDEEKDLNELEESEAVVETLLPDVEPVSVSLTQSTLSPQLEEKNKKKNLKVESHDSEHETLELMIEDQDQEQQEDNTIIGQEEAFESDMQIEEFQEIIPDDECDANLYLDENSYEDLQLYEEEENEFYEEQQRDDEGIYEAYVDVETEIIANHLDILSDSDFGDNSVKTKTKSKQNPKSSKRTSAESASLKIEGKSNICTKCNKDFSTKTNLMRHMHTHDGVKPYKCPTCGKGFTQNGSLKQHIFIHTGERPHICHVCQRGFTQSKSLIFHMRRHTGEKPFNCEECGINFRQKDGLKHHIQKYHGEGNHKTKAHICSVCDRVFSSKYALATHIKKHKQNPEEQQSEIVDECLESNVKSEKSTTKQLKAEETDYSNKLSEPISMEEVEMSEEFEPKLVNHAGAGIRMKQFQCGKCFKSFHIKRNLLRHLRNHDVSSLELHECTDCSIGFDTKRSLKLHRLRDHKDEVRDLNSCEYCDEPFATVADLSEHIANEHDAIDQNCPHCNKHFESQKLYYDHLLEHEHMLDN